MPRWSSHVVLYRIDMLYFILFDPRTRLSQDKIDTVLHPMCHIIKKKGERGFIYSKSCVTPLRIMINAKMQKYSSQRRALLKATIAEYNGANLRDKNYQSRRLFHASIRASLAKKIIPNRNANRKVRFPSHSCF